MDSETFARIRKRLHHTQQQLADEIGVHRVTIAKWESGEPIPTAIAKLMTCLDEARKWRRKQRRR